MSSRHRQRSKTLPDIKNPTIAELETFFNEVTRAIKANPVTTQAKPTANAKEEAAKLALVEAAFSRGSNGEVYNTSGGRTTKEKALEFVDLAKEISLDDMRGIVADVWYGGTNTRTFAISPLADSVKEFSKAYRECDAKADVADPNTTALPTVMNNVELVKACVKALGVATTNRTSAKIVIRDPNGVAVDQDYGGKAFCELVESTLRPFLANSAQAGEAARQLHVTENQLNAFQRVVKAAAEADATTQAGKPVEVDPVRFMSDRFNAATDQDTTRSDFFKGVDPKNPND